jgi:hypothetical protein
MNPLLYMLSGAAALAVAYGVYVGGRKVVETARALTAALGGIPKLIKSIADNSEALNKFSGELEFLRTAMLGGSPNFGPENPEAPPASPRRPLPQFPGAPPFVPVPDAEESDTQVIDTTDEELVEQENLEQVRGMGFEAEPEGNPPGIVKNV